MTRVCLRKKYKSIRREYKRLLEQAKQEKLYVLVNKYFFLTIDNVSLVQSGCHRCKVRYHVLDISGKIYNEENKYQVSESYYAQFDPWHILCKCYDDNFIPPKEVELMLKCYVGEPIMYLYHQQVQSLELAPKIDLKIVHIPE